METIENSLWLREGINYGMLGQLIGVTLFILLVLLTYFIFHLGNRHVPEDRKLRFGVEQVKLLIFLAVVVVLGRWLWANWARVLSLLAPFIIAGAISYALKPVVDYLMTWKMTRLQAVAALFAAFGLFVAGMSVTIFPALAEDVRELSQQLPRFGMQFYERVSSWYQENFAQQEYTPDNLEELMEFFGLELGDLSDWAARSAGTLYQVFSRVLSNLVTVVLVPVVTFYFLKDAEEISKLVKSSVPPPSRNWVYPLARRIDDVLGGFIRGQLLVALFVGVSSAIALMIIGIEFWIILGIVAGITNIIPYLGPFIGGAPAVVITLVTSPEKILWVLLAFVIIQQTESSIVAPRIVGKRVGMHPTLVLLVLLAGGAFWGFIGLVVAVPVSAVLKVLIEETINWLRRRYPDYFETKQ